MFKLRIFIFWYLYFQIILVLETDSLLLWVYSVCLTESAHFSQIQISVPSPEILFQRFPKIPKKISGRLFPISNFSPVLPRFSPSLPENPSLHLRYDTVVENIDFCRTSENNENISSPKIPRKFQNFFRIACDSARSSRSKRSDFSKSNDCTIKITQAFILLYKLPILHK